MFAAEAFDGAALGAGKWEGRVVEEEGSSLFGGEWFGVVDEAKLAGEGDEVVEVTVVVGGVDEVAGDNEVEVAVEHGEQVLVGAAAEVFHHFGGEVGVGQLSFRRPRSKPRGYSTGPTEDGRVAHTKLYGFFSLFGDQFFDRFRKMFGLSFILGFVGGLTGG